MKFERHHEILKRLSKFGSVKVEALHMLQRFSHVIHITAGSLRRIYADITTKRGTELVFVSLTSVR